MVNFALEGPVWATPNSVVTWSFSSPGNAGFTNAIDPAYQAAIRAAAAQWSAVGNVTLQEVAPGTPGTDITVGWGSFSGSQIGETEYSYTLGTPQTFVPGMTIHIEDPSILALSAAANATYQGTATTLYQVALHEFGHALGLGLSTDPNAVMNLRLGPSNTTLDASDIAGLAALYGTKSSAAAVAQLTASAPGVDTVAVSGSNIGIYRFFDSQTGTQFLTSSVSEINGILSTRPDLKFEGLALDGVTPGANDPNAAPVYRFFDTSNGTHFFTANKAEAAGLAASRPDLVAEQSSFSEHLTQQTGDVPVYRFFDTHAGTHFFTANDSERASLISTRPDMAFEGVAFYAPSAT